MKRIFSLTLIYLTITLYGISQTTDELNKRIAAFKESYSLEDKAEYSKAVEVLRAVYVESSYEINLRLGWLSYNAGLFSQSQAYYARSVDLMPYAIEAKFGIVYPLSALGNWDAVETYYKQILDIDPKNSIANYRLGSVYYGKLKYTQAKKHFEIVANLFPFSYDGVLMLAWTNYRLGLTREAKILFNKVLLISPDDKSAIEGLSLMK
jgi:tetratricopeptide (TPR) repeat protein